MFSSESFSIDMDHSGPSISSSSHRSRSPVKRKFGQLPSSNAAVNVAPSQASQQLNQSQVQSQAFPPSSQPSSVGLPLPLRPYPIYNTSNPTSLNAVLNKRNRIRKLAIENNKKLNKMVNKSCQTRNEIDEENIRNDLLLLISSLNSRHPNASKAAHLTSSVHELINSIKLFHDNQQIEKQQENENESVFRSFPLQDSLIQPLELTTMEFDEIAQAAIRHSILPVQQSLEEKQNEEEFRYKSTRGKRSLYAQTMNVEHESDQFNSELVYQTIPSENEQEQENINPNTKQREENKNEINQTISPMKAARSFIVYEQLDSSVHHEYFIDQEAEQTKEKKSQTSWSSPPNKFNQSLQESQKQQESQETINESHENQIDETDKSIEEAHEEQARKRQNRSIAPEDENQLQTSPPRSLPPLQPVSPLLNQSSGTQYRYETLQPPIQPHPISPLLQQTAQIPLQAQVQIQFQNLLLQRYTALALHLAQNGIDVSFRSSSSIPWEAAMLAIVENGKKWQIRQEKRRWIGKSMAHIDFDIDRVQVLSWNPEERTAEWSYDGKVWFFQLDKPWKLELLNWIMKLAQTKLTLTSQPKANNTERGNS
jgi:hypothetical protein